MRTLLISDAHGYPELIANALEHAGFRPGEDAFVYGGDFLDRGADPGRCLELVERYATEVLVGNHELAALLRFPVWPQDAISASFRPLLLERVLDGWPARPGGAWKPGRARKPGGGRESGGTWSVDEARGPSAPRRSRGPWKVATCVEGVLVTHGGVSSCYQAMFEGECGGDPALLAERLNREFLTAVLRELETGEWDEHGILGDGGPIWFRPTPWSRLLPLAGIRQVAGHTPPQEEFEAAGFYMIDPSAWLGLDDPGRFRYAVVEHGQVRVEGGTLTGSAVPDGPRTTTWCR